MLRTNTIFKTKRIIKTNKIIVLAVLLVSMSLPSGAVAYEAPDKVYSGDANASAILKNLDYKDVKSSNTWAKAAIYESGALGILKGFDNMNKRFGLTDTLSKEEAIATAYRAAGREAEAQTLGENLNNARPAGSKKTDPLEIWYDGYLQLAANEGLITLQDLTDAMNSDQNTLTPENFKRKSRAQRQEMAFWLAKTLNIQAVRGQQNIFNNYLDWRSTDPEKIPYIEAVLQNNIMNGNGSGRFNPAQSVTREQAAQVVKNAESLVLPAMKYEKLTGTIVSIASTGDYSKDPSTSGKNIDIRNSGGTLHRISTSTAAGPSSQGRNEQGGAVSASAKKELVVYKNGLIGDSSLLKVGDRIGYIAASADNSIKFVNVISNINSVRYVAAQVNSKDSVNLLINVLQFFKLDYPDVDMLKQDISFSTGSDAEKIDYRYSKNAAVTINGSKASIDDISPDSTVILTIDNNNVVTAIQSVDLGINSEERNIVRGIVEENNPQLGYITLYNEDGTGAGIISGKQLAALRTFDYPGGNKVEAFRNHQPVKPDSVQAGDTAFIKLDEDGNVISISTVDNYEAVYGKVLYIKPGEIAVEFEDGTQQLLKAGSEVIVIRDKKLTTLDSLKDGDRVKLILNRTNKYTDLKEITIEGNEHFITNVYKGAVSYIDSISNKLSVLNLQVFNKGRWERTDRKGFTGIPLSEDYKIYSGDRQIDMDKANELLADNEAYIAVETDYGGNEKAVVLSYRNSDDAEVLYSNSIAGMAAGAGSFGLVGKNNSIGFDAGSIIVKYGRLVSGSSLVNNDQAYVVANRNYGSGIYNAGVISIDEPHNTGLPRIYRARIKQINENKDFTVTSFSQLNENNWVFYNTPKTFNITFNTRILGDKGIVNVRDFTSYGDGSYADTAVYILEDDNGALLVSTAPFGTINVKGTVYDATGGNIGQEGTVLNEPDGILLRNVKQYSEADFMWKDANDMTLGLLLNSIIIKDGSIVKPSEIKKGDTVRAIKKDAGQTGDAYIVFVE